MKTSYFIKNITTFELRLQVNSIVKELGRLSTSVCLVQSEKKNLTDTRMFISRIHLNCFVCFTTISFITLADTFSVIHHTLTRKLFHLTQRWIKFGDFGFAFSRTSDVVLDDLLLDWKSYFDTEYDSYSSE